MYHTHVRRHAYKMNKTGFHDELQALGQANISNGTPAFDKDFNLKHGHRIGL